MQLSLVILFKLLFLCAPAPTDVPASIYDFKVTAANGQTIDFSAYKGKKILIVNTPCEDIRDPQYAALNALYKKYQDKLVIIGILANDFGLPPGYKKRTVPYEAKDYNVTFPLASKVLIRGNDMSPVFQWLTEKKYNNFKDSYVKWNFQKFLINENGALIAVFDPKIQPMSPEVIAAIEQ